MEKITIIGWKPGLRSIDLMNVLREVEGLGLADAKGRVDRLLSADPVSIDLHVAPEDAEHISSRLAEIGVEFRRHR